jgi:hypothetical protein
LFSIFRKPNKYRSGANSNNRHGQAGRTGRYLLYAIGEVLLVMVGILLALQADNWNEERKEEFKMLKALKTVFTTNRW